MASVGALVGTQRFHRPVPECRGPSLIGCEPLEKKMPSAAAGTCGPKSACVWFSQAVASRGAEQEPLSYSNENLNVFGFTANRCTDSALIQLLYSGQSKKVQVLKSPQANSMKFMHLFETLRRRSLNFPLFSTSEVKLLPTCRSPPPRSTDPFPMDPSPCQWDQTLHGSRQLHLLIPGMNSSPGHKLTKRLGMVHKHWELLQCSEARGQLTPAQSNLLLTAAFPSSSSLPGRSVNICE